MNEKDEAKEAADRAGGWESLARGLYDLYMTGDSKLLDAAFKREELKLLARAFNPPRGRGAKETRGLAWYFMASKILEDAKARNPRDKDPYLIGRHIEVLYGKKLRPGLAAKNAAIKTVRNALSEHRTMEKIRLKNFDPRANLALIGNYEDHPAGYGEDDPRIYEVDE